MKHFLFFKFGCLAVCLGLSLSMASNGLATEWGDENDWVREYQEAWESIDEKEAEYERDSNASTWEAWDKAVEEAREALERREEQECSHINKSGDVI